MVIWLRYGCVTSRERLVMSLSFPGLPIAHICQEKGSIMILDRGYARLNTENISN